MARKYRNNQEKLEAMRDRQSRYVKGGYKLFAMWFNSYEGRFNYTLSRVSLRIEDTDYYASLLISNSNPSYVEVLTAFNDFVKEFPGKLE